MMIVVLKERSRDGWPQEVDAVSRADFTHLVIYFKSMHKHAKITPRARGLY